MGAGAWGVGIETAARGEERACHARQRSRSLIVVDVAQRLAAAVVATLVATIAQPVVCVPPAVGAARRTGGRQGRLSGRRGGDLVLVELQ
jgi:hypothetical protein